MVILLLANIFIVSAGYWDYVLVVGRFSLLHLLLICLLLVFLSRRKNSSMEFSRCICEFCCYCKDRMIR